MIPIYLLLLVVLPLVLSQNYKVPELDYSNDDPTCDNINSLIDATNADVLRLTSYVTDTLPSRSSQLNNIYASVKKTCQIITSSRPSLLQTSKLRNEQIQTLEKLNKKIKKIAKFFHFDKESSIMFRSLVNLKMGAVKPKDLCDHGYDSIRNLKDYIRFLIPAITETYIDGILAKRLKKLQDFNEDCGAAACDDSQKKSDDEDDEASKQAQQAAEDAAKAKQKQLDEANAAALAAAKQAQEAAEAKAAAAEASAAAAKKAQQDAEAKQAAEAADLAKAKAAQQQAEADSASASQKAQQAAEAQAAAEQAAAAYKKQLQEEADAKAAAQAAADAAAKQAKEQADAAAAAKALADAIAAAAAAEKAAFGNDSTYAYYPTMDSWGGDITQLIGYTVKGLKDWCNANIQCLGFNTNGWMKFSVKTTDAWYQWTTNSSLGFYVKKSANIATFSYYPGVDSGGNDLVQMTGYTMDGLKAYCAANPNCKAFNTDGYIKGVLKPMNQWYRYGGNVDNFGLYVKESGPIQRHDYTWYANQDSSGDYDIIQINKGMSLKDIRRACDANPSCQAFNTDGTLKYVVKPTNQWIKTTNPGTFGMYVKGDLSAQNYDTTLDTYAFYPTIDSGLNDMVQLSGKNVSELKAWCDANSSCAGFNTEGYMKKVIKPINQLNRNTNTNNFGLYVKNGVLDKQYTYTSYINIDSAGNDLIQLNGGLSIDQIRAACDQQPSCACFNSDGWLKQTVKPQSQWVKPSSRANFEFYVKKT